MRDFALTRPDSAAAAIAAAGAPESAYIAGGTDLLQLMKQEVERPAHLVDLGGVLPDTIEAGPEGLRLGALARMADVAAHPEVRRGWPVISEALLASASPQVRNMGTIGGNLLQRTRCNYFRDPGFAACNKRDPGSGCAAIHGENRLLGVIGVSPHCIATHPSDLPVALVALDSEVELLGADGARRRVPLDEFYRAPGDTPQVETVLRPGELIEAVRVPASPVARASRYLKLRDRASFEFALVSCAAALDADGGVVRDVRLALGGVAHKPWRLRNVEAALRGGPATAEAFRAAAERAGEGATPASGNGFKVELMRRATRRALELIPV